MIEGPKTYLDAAVIHAKTGTRAEPDDQFRKRSEPAWNDLIHGTGSAVGHRPRRRSS